MLPATIDTQIPQLPHPPDPLPIQTKVSTDRRRWTRQCPEPPDPLIGHFLVRYPDDHRYGCIASPVCPVGVAGMVEMEVAAAVVVAAAVTVATVMAVTVYEPLIGTFIVWMKNYECCCFYRLACKYLLTYYDVGRYVLLVGTYGSWWYKKEK